MFESPFFVDKPWGIGLFTLGAAALMLGGRWLVRRRGLFHDFFVGLFRRVYARPHGRHGFGAKQSRRQQGRSEAVGRT
jgi:hypothetical protein